jgi:hypothetical protein
MFCCEQMTVMFASEGNWQRAECTSQVRVRYGNDTITAKSGIYHVEKQEIVLTGQPVLTRDKQHIRGKKIQAWLPHKTEQQSYWRLRIQQPSGMLMPFQETNAFQHPKENTATEPLPEHCPIPLVFP